MAARFIISAARPDQFPAEAEAEIAFWGRNKVGNPSLIKAVVGADGVGPRSARPGCTQPANFFQVGGVYRFVDLRGYGSAKVPRHMPNEWKELVEAYLSGRE